jgi:hypothetical protein
VTPPGRLPQHLELHHVEWRPVSPEAIEVRVVGAWHGPSVPPVPALIVEGAGRFDGRVLGAGPPPAWETAFTVPVTARAALEDGDAELVLDGAHVPLLPALPGRVGSGTVVGASEFASRLAARESSREPHGRASAEDVAETLRVSLSHLEQRLAHAVD